MKCGGKVEIVKMVNVVEIKMSMDEIINELDDLHLQRKYKELCDLFENEYRTEEYKIADLLWRYARGLRDLANNTTDKAENKRLLFKALEVP